MQTAQFLSTLIILLAMSFTCDSMNANALWCKNSRCRSDRCDECRWGKVYDEECGFEVCTKGPGEQCGRHRGECGEGLQCQCNKCYGCSSININTPCVTEPWCIQIPVGSYEWLTNNRPYATS